MDIGVLTWIERAAERRDLGLVVQAAKDMSTYASEVCETLMENEVKRLKIESWVIDI